MKANEWDTSYEWKAVTPVALGFGLVGLDRWLIAPLLPSIMKDLNLTAQDAGICIRVLGLAWGVFPALMGGISDKVGRRKVLIPAIVMFSVLSGFSGLAGGLFDLVGRRLASIVGFAGTAVMLYVFRGLGSQPLVLFAVLFVASFFTLGLMSLLSGPVATEAAPVGLVSTSIGAVVGVGEIFGGGIAPAMGGYVAAHFGIQNILWLPLCAVLLSIVVSMFLRETAPAVLQRRVVMEPELTAGKQR
jgi:predicted MFS family arabinose efflux permease